jgi:hypothetical protein
MSIMATFKKGDCVKIPDGRVGRVREMEDVRARIRVMRTTSATHQFLWFDTKELLPTSCPSGWMSPEGYNRYLKITLEKMYKRKNKQGSK